ncbi:ATPase, T2SS/T4P/T4SS family [Calditrichota bacterium GD2]
MVVTHKHVFEDDWLVKALLYYQIIDKELYDELAGRYAGEKYFFNVLIKNNYLQKEDLITFIEEALQIPVIDLDKIKIDQQLIKIIPKELCEKYQIFPFRQNESEVHIACFNPYNLEAEKEIELISGKYVKTYFALLEQVQRKIKEYYTPEELIDTLVKKDGHNLKVRVAGEDYVEEKGVVKLVNQIFAEAVANDASDIHIEAGEKEVVVRLRIDGVMHTIMELPKTLHSQLVSRIKVISNLNIAETRKPQDGKAKIIVDDADIDLRVSVLPTSYGEKVVIRLLDKRKAMVSFEQLGIRGFNLQQLEKVFSVRQGLVLVTGPTGSGKSTTLYAAINRLRSSATNILTVEDPIEYVFEGINQVQVNEKAGITFASALRSFLRQDPDVILVGEIRDAETAEIAIQAALTGHLVLSTLHTNDTFGTITRLADMGIDETKVAEALQAVIAQRLVRKLCTQCKKPVDAKLLDPKLIHFFKNLGCDNYQVHSAEGCAACNYTGYKGRTGVYEILLINRELKDALYNKASLRELRSIARKHGFRNLFEDGLSLVAEGITDYQEMLRVIQPDLSPIKCKHEDTSLQPISISTPRSLQRKKSAVKPDEYEEISYKEDDVLKMDEDLRQEGTAISNKMPEAEGEKSALQSAPKASKLKEKKAAKDPLSEIKKLAKEIKKESGAPVSRKAASDKMHAASPPPAEKEPLQPEVDILVVEDYAVTRTLLKKMLERQKGWKVREAKDGFDALDQVEKKVPDIILLDLMMPNMDGYEFLQHLRSNPEAENVPVLIITSLNGSESELKGFEFGADDFVTKPINMNLLIARIQRHLARNYPKKISLNNHKVSV